MYQVFLLACNSILGTYFTTHIILVQEAKWVFWHC